MHMVCCGFVKIDFIPTSFRVTSLALGQSHDCPSASEATLKDVGKHIASTTSTINMTKTKQSTAKPCMYYGMIAIFWLDYIFILNQVPCEGHPDDDVRSLNTCLHTPQQL